MTVADVRKWVDWSRTYHALGEKYLAIEKSEFGSPPWGSEAHNQSVIGDRETMLSCLMAQLAENPTDFHSRFVAIHYCWLAWKSIQKRRADGLFFAVDVERIVQDAFADLALVVRAIPVGQGRPDWEYLVWEVSNAHLIKDRLRALALYNHAEDLSLRPRPHIQII